MNNIITYIKSILCIGCLLFVTSCGDDGVEVVSQDVSWTMDSQYRGRRARRIGYQSVYGSGLFQLLQYSVNVGQSELRFGARDTCR